ncbi:MAG: metallophosphoesterase family protein [Gaiellaceae bacterium]
MLVAVISDTHLRSGGRPLPGWCLERVRQADQVLHAGDVAEPFLLAELGLHAPVAAVAGNVDAWQLRSVLPAVQTVELDGVSIGMLHDPGPAAGREERLLRRFPDCQAVVFGHTHMPVMHEVAGRWLLNPGSPTQPRRAPRASMLVLTIEAGRLTPELVWAPDTG